jgi:sec-independent protein translocase protein TatB
VAELPQSLPDYRTYAAAIRFAAGSFARTSRHRCIIYTCMPSFSQDIILFILGLLLFGPKKLPVLARQVGKWMAEFRRASNEFKMQMDEELRLSEQAERQAKIAAMESAAPATPALEAGTENSVAGNIDPEDPHAPLPDPPLEAAERVDGVRPLPIATSGELSIMPPATGLPVAQTGSQSRALDSIPTTQPEAAAHTEASHGD